MKPEDEQLIFEIEVYGFTLIKNVLNLDELKELRQALDLLINQTRSSPNNNKKRRLIPGKYGAGRIEHEELLRNLVTRNPIYFKLIDHPRLLNLIEHFLGSDLILASLNSRILYPGDQAQRLHSDIPPALIKTGSPIMMNSIWILDDFTEDNGATWFVPGSHQSSYANPPPNREIKYAQQILAPSGSVILFNGQCWHGGGANKSERIRRAIFGQYRVASWMRFQFDPHHKFPQEWWHLLNLRQKQLLRMENGVSQPHGADIYDNF